MTIATFSLVNKIPITIFRREAATIVKGRPVESDPVEVIIQGNLQPFSAYQVYIMPESDRSRNWLWLFTTDMVRARREGVNGWAADRFMVDGEMYEVMASQKYTMQIRDHYEIKAARVELTPN